MRDKRKLDNCKKLEDRERNIKINIETNNNSNNKQP